MWSGFDSRQPDMSFETSGKHELNSQDQLRTNFLDGTIDVRTFADGLIELDQSTGERIGALKNLSVLQDDEVKAKFLALGESMEYYILLGFTAFHVGQIYAIAEGDKEKALESFKLSLDAYTQVDFDEELSYGEATIAFLEGDIERLKKLATIGSAGANQEVVERLRDYLERGVTDYRQAYYGL